MTRQRKVQQFLKVVLLFAPGSALLATGTSCGDALKDSLVNAGVEFVGTTTTELLTGALEGALSGTNTVTQG